MKRLLVTCLLLGLTCFALTAGAAAPESGIYLENASSLVTLSPRQENGAEATSRSVDCNNDGTEELVYSDAVRFTVGYTGSFTLGEQYSILMYQGDTLSVDSILYLNQITITEAEVTEGVIYFDVYPTAMTKGTIKMASSAADFGEAITLATIQEYIPYVLGDVNEDQSIDILDSMDVLDHFVKNIVLQGAQWLAADVNLDESVDIMDAIGILDYFVGNIDSF